LGIVYILDIGHHIQGQPN